MSDAAVRGKTGNTGQERFAILGAADATKLTHKEIVAYLREHSQMKPWWQRMVTVVYEQ